MSVKLYIEGFPSTLSDDELGKLFAPFGTVISVVIARTITDESMCFAEVQMAKTEEAEKAIEALHHSRMDGKLILVFHDVWPGSATARRPGRSRSRPEDSLI